MRAQGRGHSPRICQRDRGNGSTIWKGGGAYSKSRSKVFGPGFKVVLKPEVPTASTCLGRGNQFPGGCSFFSSGCSFFPLGRDHGLRLMTAKRTGPAGMSVVA